MSLLTHQSFANTDTPYWASASKPTSLVSPLSVIDTYGVPTKKVTVTANANGTGGVFYSGSGGGNPFGMAFAQGATQPSNQLIFDLGNVNPVLVLGTSNVISSQSIVLDSPLNAQDFTILPTPSSVELQMGGASGSVISMGNAPFGLVTVMGASSFDTGGMTVIDKVGGQSFYGPQGLFCSSGAGTNIARFGISGTSAYVGTQNAPLTETPGVLVNKNNGCELQFADATGTVFGMKSSGGFLQVATPMVPNAITIAASGVVTIPEIVSGSFVPIGGIIMFNGNPVTLPPNWKVCDGAGGLTPDLTNKFVIGAGTFAAGTSGGSPFLTTGNLPPHIHGVTDPGHNHTSASVTSTAGSGKIYTAENTSYGPAIPTSSNVTGITIQSTGDGIAYYPPYYSLVYIMRIS